MLVDILESALNGSQRLVFQRYRKRVHGFKNSTDTIHSVAANRLRVLLLFLREHGVMSRSSPPGSSDGAVETNLCRDLDFVQQLQLLDHCGFPRLSCTEQQNFEVVLFGFLRRPEHCLNHVIPVFPRRFRAHTVYCKVVVGSCRVPRSVVSDRVQGC